MGFKDKLTNRSGRGGVLGGFVSLSSGFVLGVGTSGTSATSSFAFGSITSSFGSVTSAAFSSDSSALIFDDVLVLSLFVLPEWINGYFQVRGTTSSVRLRYSER